MSHDVNSKISKLLGNQRQIAGLLHLEKERRGVDRDKLVFVGMANVANYYWCAMQAVVKSRQLEADFFASYLHDRLSYSFRLGLIDDLPKSKSNLLEVGNDIGLGHIEQLLKARAEKKASPDVHVLVEAVTKVDSGGNKVIVLNPDLPQEAMSHYEEQAKSEGARLAIIEEFPAIRGEFLQTTRAEQYPTIRWNFTWQGYVVVGVPDGITDGFVYEFKTTGAKFLMYYVKPVAITQADLYGHFFRRPNKRVQILIVGDGVTETWENKVDENKAIKVLSEFRKVDEGWIPYPPKAWKCKLCQFKDTCTLKAA